MPSSTPAIALSSSLPKDSTRKRGRWRNRTCSLRNVDNVRHVRADNAMTAGEDGGEDEDAHRLPERDRLQPEDGRHGMIPDPAEHKHEDDEAYQGPSNEQNRSYDGIHGSSLLPVRTWRTRLWRDARGWLRSIETHCLPPTSLACRRIMVQCATAPPLVEERLSAGR